MNSVLLNLQRKRAPFAKAGTSLDRHAEFDLGRLRDVLGQYDLAKVSIGQVACFLTAVTTGRAVRKPQWSAGQHPQAAQRFPEVPTRSLPGYCLHRHAL